MIFSDILNGCFLLRNPWALSASSVFWGFPLRWILGHLLDLYPLERTSASYQRDLRFAVLEKCREFGIHVPSFQTFVLSWYPLARSLLLVNVHHSVLPLRMNSKL